jgi:hypothetical protein
MVVPKGAARALTALTVAATLAVSTGPATADATSYDDPVGDSTSVDISRVRVVHRHAVAVRVHSAVPLAAGQVYTFWIGTGRGTRPTYAVTFRANSDFGGQLAIVESFGRRPSRFVDCPGMRAHADMFDDRPVSVRIPRTCLGDPRRVRVAVRFADEQTGDVDWAPERRTFGPWVRR